MDLQKLSLKQLQNLKTKYIKDLERQLSLGVSIESELMRQTIESIKLSIKLVEKEIKRREEL